MTTQAVDYEAVVKDLERRRANIIAEFDAAIAAMRRISFLHSANSSAAIAPSLPFSPSDRLQPYRGMQMVDAAMEHIRRTGHAVPNLALARDLEAGGFAHKSKNFPNTLNSVLWRRAKTVADIRKSAQGWEIVSAQ